MILILMIDNNFENFNRNKKQINFIVFDVIIADIIVTKILKHKSPTELFIIVN